MLRFRPWVDPIEPCQIYILVEMSGKLTQKMVKVRINTIIEGEPATALLEWKRRGIVRSNTDAIRQSFRLFQEKLVEADLQASRIGGPRYE